MSVGVVFTVLIDVGRPSLKMGSTIPQLWALTCTGDENALDCG